MKDDVKKALEARKIMRKKRPNFVRQDAPNMKRIPENWRRPSGLQSKARRAMKGHVSLVRVGYGTPVLARGVHRSGLMPVVVANAADLKKIKPETEAAVFSGTLGMRKKVELVKLAQELKVTILNLKDANEYAEHAAKALKERKVAKDKRDKAKQASKESLEKKLKKDEKAAEAKDSAKDATKDAKDKDAKSTAKSVKEDVKESKEEEKKERDKILTKRDA